MSETTTESLPDLVVDEAWSEYVYPRAAVGDLSHPSEHSGFVRAMRVLRKWANDHDEFWSGLLELEQRKLADAEARLADLRYNLALRACTAPDADDDTMLASLDARIRDAVAEGDRHV
jgi:hypothetical protein